MRRRIVLLGVVAASVFTFGVSMAAIPAGEAADADPNSSSDFTPHFVTLGVGLVIIAVGTVILYRVASRGSRREPK